MNWDEERRKALGLDQPWRQRALGCVFVILLALGIAVGTCDGPTPEAQPPPIELEAAPGFSECRANPNAEGCALWNLR